MPVTTALLASALALGSMAAPSLQNDLPDVSAKADIRLGITDLEGHGGPEHVANLPASLQFSSWATRGTQINWLTAVTDDEHDLSLNVFHARAKPFLAKIIERLRDGLGPAWRVGTNPAVLGPPTNFAGTVPPGARLRARPAEWIVITGPRSEDPSAPRLKAAVLALSDEQTESERARSLPAGPARTDAEARARDAAARANEAMGAVRIENAILPVEHADAENITKALKLALPWATFTSVGGTQIMASGTKDELASAKTLVTELDAAAAKQMAEARTAAERRGRDTMAGRVLAQQINIDFKGGQLPEYLNQIGGVANVTSWVIEDPRVTGAYVPSVKLTGVTVDSALKLLDGMLFPSADKAQPVNAMLKVTRIDPDKSNPDAPPIYRIGAVFPPADPVSALTRPAQPKTQPPTTVTDVFDVAVPDPEEGQDPIVKAREAHEALLAAIEAGVGLLGPSPSFKVKLHPPSGMLFVSGSVEEMMLVRNIVQQWQSRR